MITLRNIILRRGPKILLQDVNWTIFRGQRIGIIGPNGAGKTSLFALLLQALEADGGDLEIPAQLKLAHVAQETPAYSKSALDFVLDGDAELRALEAELTLAEQADDGLRIANLYAQLGEIDAYTAPARAGQLLAGLGFSTREQQQSVSDFSGGWRVRLNLAKALMSRSDVLLLDEPTNHLDLDAVIWLEQWLLNYQGTLLLISHDREFLDKVVNHIAHIHQQTLKLYTGNYSSFEKQRAAQLLLQQAAYEKQQKQIAHLQKFIDRFKAKASKARQAQSRVKAIERMELVGVVKVDSEFEFSFIEPKKHPNPLININEGQIAYGDKIVLNRINLGIAPKDRIALLGPNGAGKTSLIKLLAGEITPATGTRETGEGLKIGYFAQHQVDTLDLQDTPLAHLRKLAPQQKEQELRTFLGTFGFSGQRAFEPIHNFSGGEKSRLALALLVWQQPNLLLLDEPTNHLDLDMRHALSMALQEYQGAMVLVSHDRFLVQTTADKLLLVAEHKVNDFDGDLNDYEQWLFNFRRQSGKEPSVKKVSPPVTKNSDTNKALTQKVKKLEDTLTKLQAKAATVEAALADLSIYEAQNKEKLQTILNDQAHIAQEVQAAEIAWLQACEELERLSH